MTRKREKKKKPQFPRADCRAGKADNLRQKTTISWSKYYHGILAKKTKHTA